MESFKAQKALFCIASKQHETEERRMKKSETGTILKLGLVFLFPTQRKNTFPSYIMVVVTIDL